MENKYYIVTIPALAFGPAADQLRMTEEQAREFERLADLNKTIYVTIEPQGTVMRLSPFNLAFSLFDEEEKMEMPYQATEVRKVSDSLFEKPQPVAVPARRFGTFRSTFARDYPAYERMLREDELEELTGIEKQDSESESDWWNRVLQRDRQLELDPLDVEIISD